MDGNTNSNSIDSLLDDLFETLFLGPSGPLVGSRMTLRPNSAATSHFMAPPRSRMTRNDLARIEAEGLFAELARVLDDLPTVRRDEVLGKIRAIVEALPAQQRQQDSAEPPTLIYALY